MSGENKKALESQLNSMLAKNKEFIISNTAVVAESKKDSEDKIKLTGSAESDDE